jgi:hypothetical protein
VRRSTTRRGARPAGASVRVRPCGLSVGLRLRRRGFDSSCAPKGPRPGGGRARWAGFSGCDLRGTQDSAFVSWEPRLLRSLRNPVTNAEAFGLQLTKEESWAHLGVGWAALLPSRGTVHEKEEALPPPPPQRLIHHPSSPGKGGRSTADIDSVAELPLRGQERRTLRPMRPTAREPEPPPLPAARSRPSRRPHPRGAAPALPLSRDEPRSRSRSSTRSRADAAEGRAEAPDPPAEGQGVWGGAGSPDGIRTRATALRGRRARPLHNGATVHEGPCEQTSHAGRGRTVSYPVPDSNRRSPP